MNQLTPFSKVAPNEIKEVVAAFADKGDLNGTKRVQSSGLHIAGDRYVVIKADDRSLYGKKVSWKLSTSGDTSQQNIVGLSVDIVMLRARRALSSSRLNRQYWWPTTLRLYNRDPQQPL